MPANPSAWPVNGNKLEWLKQPVSSYANLARIPADDHEPENVFHEDQQRVMISKFEVTSAPITAQKLEVSAQTLSRSTLNFGG
jgi:hypothetical protein